MSSGLTKADSEDVGGTAGRLSDSKAGGGLPLLLVAGVAGALGDVGELPRRHRGGRHQRLDGVGVVVELRQDGGLLQRQAVVPLVAALASGLPETARAALTHVTSVMRRF
jgi:hypothetical protein